MRISDWSSDVCSSDLGWQKQPENGQGQRADWDIDVKTPAPAVVLGQPAAEHRTHDRTNHDAHAPDRHRLCLSLRRIDVHHHRLGKRGDKGPANALEQTERHHFLQACGDAAEHRRNDEAADGDQEEVPRSKEHTSELPSLMRISYAVFCLQTKKTIY